MWVLIFLFRFENCTRRPTDHGPITRFLNSDVRHADHPFEVIGAAHKAKCITNCSFDLVFKIRLFQPKWMPRRAQGLIHFILRKWFSQAFVAFTPADVI